MTEYLLIAILAVLVIEFGWVPRTYRVIRSNVRAFGRDIRHGTVAVLRFLKVIK